MPLTAGETLNLTYLEVRSAIIEVAAALDRLDRLEGHETVRDDPRLAGLREAIRELASDEPGRVQRILAAMSDPVE